MPLRFISLCLRPDPLPAQPHRFEKEKENDYEKEREGLIGLAYFFALAARMIQAAEVRASSSG